MVLELAHTKLQVYHFSRLFAVECYKLTKNFPSDERFALTQQISRAAISVHLNIAEGCSRKSETERKRYFEIARGSVIEIDAAPDIASDLNYCKKEDILILGDNMIKCFKFITGLIKA